MGRNDTKKCEGLTIKMGRSYLEKGEGLTQKNGRFWLEKWEILTWKSGKDWPEKMGRSDSKNKDSLGKALTRKKWEGLSWKSGKDWLEKWEGLTRKMGRSDSKHGRSESKQGRSDSKTGRSGLTRKKVLMTLHSHRKNGYSLVQKPLLEKWPDNFFYISVMKIVPKKSQKINMLSRNFYVKESLLDVS